MERDLLMLSQRLMLMLTTDTVLDTALLDIMERDLLMLSQRLMLTTDTVLDTALLDMVTDHMDTQLMVLMDVSGDKLYATQLRSSKANNQNQWQSVPKKIIRNYCWCRNLS